MAAIFDVNGSGRLGREINLKGGERGGGKGVKIRLPEVIVLLPCSVRPRTEFLIGAIKLQLSITRCQSFERDILLMQEKEKDGEL